MATRLIELEDKTLIEIEIPGDQVEPIAGGVANKVDSTLKKIKPVLVNACKPIIEAWHELNQEMHIEQAEVELGLSFEGEGNIYVTRSKTGANLGVKLILKPKVGHQAGGKRK
jgi:hypothetical protein